ncbi:MAG: cupin [Hyphomicrobiaceae bacterium]
MRSNMVFENLNLDEGFKEYDGKVAGISEKILSNDLDVAAASGKRARLLRLKPGVQTPAAHAHPYWEEIYVISGSMIEGTAETGEKRVVAPAFASREPGFVHGPVRTDEECLLIEFSWFPDAND